MRHPAFILAQQLSPWFSLISHIRVSSNFEWQHTNFLTMTIVINDSLYTFFISFYHFVTLIVLNIYVGLFSVCDLRIQLGLSILTTNCTPKMIVVRFTFPIEKLIKLYYLKVIVIYVYSSSFTVLIWLCWYSCCCSCCYYFCSSSEAHLGRKTEVRFPKETSNTHMYKLYSNPQPGSSERCTVTTLLLEYPAVL